MKSNLSVCVLLDAFDHLSGVRTTYNSMLYMATEAGVDLTIIAPAPRNTRLEVQREGTARMVRAPARFSVHLPADIRLDWPDWRQLRQIVTDAKPDILHTVSPGPLGLYGGRLARSLGVPLAGYFHTDYLNMQTPQVLAALYPNPVIRFFASRVAQTFNRVTERVMYAPCDAVLCEAQKIVDQVRARRLNANPVLAPATLRHDLPAAPPTRAAGRARFGLADDRKVVLFAGRFAPDKNVPMVVTAAARCPDITFVAAGAGPLQHLLEGKPNLRMVGRLHGGDMWLAYAAADVLLMPSWYETFGLVSLEAMAMGLPVLTADTAGSAPDVLEAGAGVAFSPTDPDGCVTALRAALDDAAGLARMRANALAWAAHNRPIDRYRRFVDAAYRPLVDR
ncbi:MAG: glycosyltransferase [Anaerolineae bacterium]|nr:glycosyltransferase [Anaerolineae bacterium]